MSNMPTQKYTYHGSEIAIIGLSGRFPGARTIEQFWQNLKNGVESISFFSEQELLEQGNDPRQIREPNYVPAKGFVADLDGFDATFFEYTPKEAQFMDPQFRLLHECVWEALEDAGYNPKAYRKAIGLFAGAAFNEWWIIRAFAHRMAGNSETLETATVTLRDYLCTLVSYKLDLKGPSFTLQTACSTSLVAIHQASQALLSGECSLAAAGGVSINLPSKAGYLYQDGMIQSADGHCRSFDAQASGTVFGDGAGMVVLKRLQDAIDEGDHIYAVIRGSAINNDGNQKVGYTAPSTKGQMAVIRAALRVAEVAPESISYVEAHGTATPLGDPIEIEALKAAFRTEQRHFCHLGSVKSNLGHLNAASGIAGLIKTVLALQHRQIPPSLHFTQPNPKIDWTTSPFVVATQLTPWINESFPLRAGVSSFGIGGTNAHVILEEAPALPAPHSCRATHLLLLSAKTPTALQQMSERLRHFLQSNPHVSLADVAYTLQVGRAHFAHRRLVLCSSISEAIELLAAPVTPPTIIDTTSQDQLYAHREQLIRALLQHEQEAHTDVSEVSHLLLQLGQLWLAGMEVDWATTYAQQQRRISLPTYPFERQRFWLDEPAPLWLFQAQPKVTHADPDPTLSTSGATGGESLHLHTAIRVDHSRSKDNDIDQIEKTLTDMWLDVLGVEVGPTDNFFDVGGDSLKATGLASRLQKECGLALRLSDIFQFPTIQAMSQHLRGLETTEDSAIVPAGEKAYYALSSSQKRTYIIQRNIGLGTTYNYPMVLLIYGTPDRQRVETAFHQLIQRHEILRTTFTFIDGQPVQQIHHRVAFSIHSFQADEAELDACIQAFIQPFHLAEAPLLRVTLLQLATQKYALLLDMHNIIADGSSMNIFVKEFCALYKGETLAPLAIQYKDYAEWQQRFLETPLMHQQETYWLHRFSTIPSLAMPLDFPRSQIQDFTGATVQFLLSPERSEKLRQFAREHTVTLNTIFYSLFTLLLHKYTDQVDIVVGSLVAGRRRPEVAHLIGLFTNFLPVRNSLAPDATFSQFLESTNRLLLEAYDHQDYPFDLLVEKLSQRIPRNRNPLFDAMFVYHNEYDPQVKLDIAGLRFAEYEFAKDTAKLDLKLDIVDLYNGTHKCVLQYNHQLYLRETIDALIAHFLELSDHALQQPESTLASLEIFTLQEKQTIAAKRSAVEQSSSSNLSETTLVVSATFTAAPIANYVTWWGQHFGHRLALQFSGYHQVFQDLLNPTSLLSLNKGANLLLIRFEDWLRDDHLDEATQIKNLEQNFHDLVKIISDKAKIAPYFVSLFPRDHNSTLSHTVQTYIDMLNLRWKQALSSIEQIYLLDFRTLVQHYDIPIVFDPITDRAAHLPFTDEFYAAMGTEIARHVIAWKNPPFKVIVLDCDGTLWKGIVGEDGPANICIDPPYLALQQFMAQKRQEGFLLALCSKNNQADVWEVFDSHRQMVLKKDDFVSWRINWQAKSHNIKAMAAELKLGLESFLVLDDSATECAEIMTHCPEALTLLLPSDARQIPLFLSHIWAFDRLKITAEDQQRSAMYRAERQRQNAQADTFTQSDFLRSLNLKMSMRPLEQQHITRIAQMTQRTNQFNLSTIRRNEQQIQALLAQPTMPCWIIEVADRFGSYGITGAVFAQQIDHQLCLDTFLLSCRVLGRNIEEAILDTLMGYCQADKIDRLIAHYYPTAKNQPFKEFLSRTEWTPIKQTAEYIAYAFDLQKGAKPIHWVDIYDNIPFPQEQDNADDTIMASSESLRSEEATIAPLLDPTVAPDLHWEMALVNEARLLHRAYYTPIEYASHAQLRQLPVNIGLLSHATRPFVPPRNDLEQQLCQLWADILEVAEIGIDDIFFEIGGNSLLAIKLEVELEKHDLIIEGESIFLNPTVRQYAAKLSGRDQHSPSQSQETATVQQTSSPEYTIISGIEPFNDFIYKNCFYSSAFPVILYLKRSILPFLINDSIVYRYDADQSDMRLTTVYEPILPIESILQAQGIELLEKERTGDVINDCIHAIAQGRPVVLWVDCFYESIRPDTYCKTHHPHTLLLYGYDRSRQHFAILEHKHVGSPFYEKREISFSDIEHAYEGFLHHFHTDQPMTYYEFTTAPARVELTEDDLASLFQQNSLQHRSLISNGIAALHRFEPEFTSLIENPATLSTNAEQLIFGLNEIITAKKVEVYKLEHLHIDQAVTGLLKETVNGWSAIRAMIAKFHYSGRYQQKAIEAAVTQLHHVIACESAYTERLFHSDIRGGIYR